jgi:choline kinase
MAGDGRRFRNVGIDTAKHMIAVKDKTLFEWALSSLMNFYDNKFIFVVRKSHNSTDFINEKCQLLGIKDFEIETIDYLTKGQASTALEAEGKIQDSSDSIMIYNIDTYVEPDQLEPGLIKGDGWIPAFRAEGDKWSFVKFGDDLEVTEVTEKERISEFGTIGLYYFKSFNLFKKCYSKYKFESYREEYIAPLYNFLIKDPFFNLYTHIIDKNAVHVLGTPEDVIKFWPEFRNL